MVAELALYFAWTASQQAGQMWTKTELPMPPNSTARLYYQESKDPLDPPRLSTKRFGEDKIQWEFPFIVAGYSHVTGDKSLKDIRFRVYSQEQKGGRSAQVARMMLRLWNFNRGRLRLIQNPMYHDGLVDVFLCFGGKAGAEQLIDDEVYIDKANPATTKTLKANVIYIYDVPSFTDPVEMAREVAHVYGLATLPRISGYSDPEFAAAGYLSEKLYLRWLRDAITKGELSSADAMDATKEGLDKWITENVDPAVMQAAVTEPTEALLGDRTAKGMNAFVGLALYIETIYPEEVFRKSIESTSSDAKDYPAAIVKHAEEPDQVTLKLPPQLIGKLIWVPLGTGKLFGTKILKATPSGWVQVQATDPIVIRNFR